MKIINFGYVNKKGWYRVMHGKIDSEVRFVLGIPDKEKKTIILIDHQDNSEFEVESFQDGQDKAAKIAKPPIIWI